MFYADSSGIVHPAASPHGQGSGPIWLDDVQCESYHTRIEDCPRNHWAVNNCDHSEDVGLTCIPCGQTTTRILTTPSYVHTTPRYFGNYTAFKLVFFTGF